jgi:hypothetical protein
MGKGFVLCYLINSGYRGTYLSVLPSCSFMFYVMVLMFLLVQRTRFPPLFLFLCSFMFYVIFCLYFVYYGLGFLIPIVNFADCDWVISGFRFPLIEFDIFFLIFRLLKGSLSLSLFHFFVVNFYSIGKPSLIMMSTDICII